MEKHKSCSPPPTYLGLGFDNDDDDHTSKHIILPYKYKMYSSSPIQFPALPRCLPFRLPLDRHEEEMLSMMMLSC